MASQKNILFIKKKIEIINVFEKEKMWGGEVHDFKKGLLFTILLFLKVQHWKLTSCRY